MKYKLKNISRRTLAMILCILMMFSTLMVGTITASANVDYTTNSTIFYLKPNSNWKSGGARFATYFCNGDSSAQWMSMSETSSGSGIYWCYAPAGNYKHVIFCRMNGSQTTNIWDNKWNQTTDLELGNTNNRYTVMDNTWDKGGGTWDTYVPTPTTKSISADKTSVDEGGTVTFTPSIDTTYAVIKSNSYTVTGGSSSDYTINNATNKITFNKAGTYTVTDKITYNAKGFNGITGTVTTAGVQINVKSSQPYTFYWVEDTTYSGFSGADAYKANPNYASAGWTGSVDMIDTGKTYNKKRIFSATLVPKNDYLYEMQILAYKNGSQTGTKLLLNNTRTAVDSINTKMYYNGNWIDYREDAPEKTYNVTIESVGDGVASFTPTTVAPQIKNAVVIITPTYVSGYEYDTPEVSNGTAVRDGNKIKVTVNGTGDVVVKLKAKKSTYTVNVTAGEGGTVTANKTTANMGDIITLTATPNMGYFLKSITVTKAGGGTVSCTNNSFTMPAGNVTVSATFITYKITGSITTAGTTVDKDENRWDNFDNGVSFNTKVKDGVYSKTITLTSTDLTELRNKFRLIDNSKLIGGIANVVYRPSDSDSVFDDGNGNKGYLITNKDSETNAYSTVNGESSNFFYFDTAGTYTIYIKYVAGGNPIIWVARDKFELTSTTTNCTVEFYSDSALTNEITQSKAKETVYVKVTPNANYEIKTVTANNGVTLTPVAGKENVYSFTMPGADVNVKATAETIKQKITFSFSNSSLSVSYILNGTTHNSQTVQSGSNVTVDKGTTLSINATLSAGYEAVTPTPWIIAPAPTSVPTTTATTCRFTVSGDATVTYNTKKIDYSISYVYNPTQGGTSAVKVNGNAVTKLNIGDKFTVDQTVNTEGGYEIASVVVKAGTSTLSPDPDGIYTMTTGNVTVTTTYKAIKPTISNCPTDTVKLYAGATYTIPATTDYGTLSYTESTGDFKFNGKVATAPNKEGTYVITVTATNKPAGITTAATTTATINVIVEFTETQKAYKALEAKFAEIGHEKKEYYDTLNHLTEWTAYENAVKAAETLLATFPLPTATNKTDYTNAQTTLQNAYDAIQPYKKVNTIYVLSKYAPESTSNKGYVNIYMFNGDTSESYEPVGNVKPVTADGSAYAMTKLGTVKVNGVDKYLYKFEYFGKGDFIVYVGENSNSAITDSNKLTGNVTTCKGFTSYYLDLKDTSKATMDFGSEHSGTIVSPYVPLSVELTNKSDTCLEDVTYNLGTKISKTEGGTLKGKSNVTVNHTYTDTLNGDTKEITSPTTWKPTEPGIHTITITSSTGVETEDVTNTFTLYVQDKLDKPVVSINGVSDSNVTVNNETDIVLSVSSSGEAYPEGVKYVFTVDGKTYESDTPTYTLAVGTENALDLGNHTVSVKVIAPNTKIVGTEIKQFVDSDVSDARTVTVETVKYQYTFDFTNCHVAANNLAYTIDGESQTTTDLSGTIIVDKDRTVTFTITMSGNYKPIPNDKCWSGVNGATIGENKLSYSFTATSANANSTIVFKSYLPAVLSPESQDIKIGTAATITIDALDSNTATNYQLLFKEENDTEYSVASATLNENEFTTSNLAYGKYKFKVRQYITGEYEYESNVVDVNAVIGTIELKYYYKEYNDLNGLAYDPYIGKVNNLKSTATEYSITLEEDMSKALSDTGRVDLYKQNAPNIHSNYFNYTLDTTGLEYETSTDKKKCTVTGPVMEANERTYNVSINGEKKNEFTSYYQQKTFLLDAANYRSEGTYGYVWYNVDSENNRTVVSTDRYYKLRVARDTNLCVEALDTEVKTPTTIINEPVYNEYTTAENAVKVQMNMLVENYLPDDAVRTRTGVVYYAFNNDTTPPTINSTQLVSLIANSNALANAEAGKTCTVGTTANGTEIKGYYTAKDNVNGKFIFGPIASITSKKTYVLYSYLTYIQDNVSKTIISRPVTASVKMYKAESTKTN